MNGSREVIHLPLREAIRKRPLMYIGDRERIGGMRIVSSALNLMQRLSLGDALDTRRRIFAHHAFLDIHVCGPRISVLIDFDEKDAVDIERASVKLFALLARADLRWEEGSDVATVASLTENLEIFGELGGDRIPGLLERGEFVDIDIQCEKGSWLAFKFDLVDEVDPRHMTRDFVEGFLAALPRAAGLVTRHCRAG